MLPYMYLRIKLHVCCINFFTIEYKIYIIIYITAFFIEPECDYNHVYQPQEMKQEPKLNLCPYSTTQTSKSKTPCYTKRTYLFFTHILSAWLITLKFIL